jgi:hypothetical protein
VRLLGILGLPERWYVSDVEKKLVLVRRINGYRKPHRLPVTVIGHPQYLIHRNAAVRRELEEVRLGGVRHANGNPVAITDLLERRVLAKYCTVPSSILRDA